VRAAAESFLAKINLRTGNFVHLLEVARRFDVAPAIESCVQYAEAPDNFHRLFACVQPRACMAYCLHVLLAAAMLKCTVAQTQDVCAAASSDTVHLLRNPTTCKQGLLLVFSFVSFEPCRLKGDQWLESSARIYTAAHSVPCFAQSLFRPTQQKQRFGMTAM
jgi:hypothetical protein